MDADRHDDEVVGLYESLLSAWNRRDGDGMAVTFADDGEMIGFDGSQVTGRSEIASEMNRIFAEHETASFVWKVRNARALGPGLALLRAVAGMVPPGQSDINPDVNTHHTVLASRSDDAWRIVLFQNTPAQFHGRPELKERLTEELRRVI
jgi:uncharacterized protein (TIGR02246 family)